MIFAFLSYQVSGVERPVHQSSGSTHRKRALYESVTALPAVSFAGVKRARRVRRRQAVSSSVLDPLDEVTVQFVTRPSVPMSSRKPVVPLSPARIAESG
jgi:hypothetical protein